MEKLKIGVSLEGDGSAIKGLDKIDDKIDRISKTAKKSSGSISKMSKGFKGLSKSAGSAAKSMGGIARGGLRAATSMKGLAAAFGGMLILRKVNAMMSEAIDLYKKQEIATARLTSIAKGVAKATDDEVKSLIGLSEEYQRVTTFGDDVIQSGLSQILSFGVTAKEAGKLTGTLTDLLAANKGVDASQDDAINAANMMGKALNGQAGALSRAGILLDDRQKKLIQEGDQATKVNTLIEVMNDNYGGLAKAFAETNLGKLTQAKNALGDMKEVVGEELLPAMISLQNASISWYKFLLDNKGTVIKAISSIATLIDDTLIGWTFLMGGDGESQRAAKNFQVVAAEITYYGQEVKRTTEHLEALEKRGIYDSDEHVQFSKKFEAASKAQADALTYLDELKNKAKGSSGLIAAALNTETNSLKLASDAVVELTHSYEGLTVEQENWLTSTIKEGAKVGSAARDKIAADRKTQEAEISDQRWIELKAENDREISEEAQKQEALKGLAANAVSSAMSIASSLVAISNNRANAEVANIKKTADITLSATNFSTRGQLRIKKKAAKEQEKIQKDAAKKNQTLQGVQAGVNTASGILGAWSNAMQLPSPANIIVGTANSALMTGVGIAQLAAIKSQSFSDGGVGGVFGGAKGSTAGGPDNTTANVRNGEMVMTGRMQRNLLDIARGSSAGGASVGNINITVQGNASDETVAALNEVSINMMDQVKAAVTELSYRGEILDVTI